MTTLNDFNKTDLVDDHVAADVNNLIAAALRAEYANTETISATKELADSDTPFQVLTPSGADRTVELAPEATTNHVTVIYNPVGTSYNVLVKDDSGSTTYALLDAGEWALCVPIGGSVWKVQKMERYEIPANGGMVNGKLSVTVSSNNLTVAIKTLAGNDPSAGDPVRVRINDTEHRITAALTVTKNAGTNWCNAGSAELATKEIDYFAYLGYNATDGVVLGFSRIPYGTQYDSFSTTSTAETYCAISTITNAASTDPYVVVGRFAATLSAGAGYTWTVPTYTPTNLVQRPILETRQLTWQPAYSASGSMTYGTVTTSFAEYHVRGRDCFVEMQAIGTTGGVASSTVYATLPFESKNVANQPVIPAWVLADTTAEVGYAYSDAGTPDRIAFRRTAGTNWTLASGHYINGGGRYAIA